jgi:hypothetical protein
LVDGAPRPPRRGPSSRGPRGHRASAPRASGAAALPPRLPPSLQVAPR